MKLSSKIIIFIIILIFPSSGLTLQIKINNDTFVNFQNVIRFFYLNQDKNQNKNQNYDYRQNMFKINKFRVGVNGHLNKLISFYIFIDAKKDKTQLWEGAVQINCLPEFIFKIGKIRVPFSRHNFISRHNSPVMTSDGDIFLPNQFKEALKAINPYAGGYKPTQPFHRTDKGIVITGFIKEGLFKYYIGLFNEDRGKKYRVWDNGFRNVTILKTPKNKESFEYDFRLEFTPTFLGFKSEKTPFNPAMRESQTYFGKIDTMTFGIGYHQEKHLDSADENVYGSSSLIRRGYAVDFFVEKRFGKYIPGLEAGYIYFDNTHFYKTSDGTYKKGNAKTWYIDLHLIYKDKINFLIPGEAIGLGFRYEHLNINGEYKDEKDLIYNRYGVCLSYYFHGRSNRIGIGFDSVKAKDALREYLKDNNWEDSTFTWYIGIYTKF